MGCGPEKSKVRPGSRYTVALYRINLKERMQIASILYGENNSLFGRKVTRKVLNVPMGRALV